SRSVRVTPVKASELPGAAGGSFIWSTSPEALRESMLRMREFAPPPPVPPSAPVPPVAPTAPRVRTILRDVRTL
ncbi:MAG TPA: hypothetical protein PK788_13100, partial [Gemmatimonadaceae bacterium]|nr:hypothetical protein [Gemmatimonadaceae bacterium]